MTTNTSTDTALLDRFVTDFNAWHAQAFGRIVDDTYPVIVDQSSYSRVVATLADIKANPDTYADYMREWLDIDADEDATAWPTCRKCGELIGQHVATRYGTEWEHMECPASEPITQRDPAIIFYTREGFECWKFTFRCIPDAKDMLNAVRQGHKVGVPNRWYAADLYDGTTRLDSVINGYAS